MAVVRKARRGAQAIEFALIIPVLMMITAGIVDWSWFYSRHLSILHEVREGMRYAAAADSDTEPNIEADAKALIEGRLEDAGYPDAVATPTVAWETDTCMMTISVTDDYSPLWGLMPTPGQHVINEMIRVEDQDHCP